MKPDPTPEQVIENQHRSAKRLAGVVFYGYVALSVAINFFAGSTVIPDSLDAAIAGNDGSLVVRGLLAVIAPITLCASERLLTTTPQIDKGGIIDYSRWVGALVIMVASFVGSAAKFIDVANYFEYSTLFAVTTIIIVDGFVFIAGITLAGHAWSKSSKARVQKKAQDSAKAIKAPPSRRASGDAKVSKRDAVKALITQREAEGKDWTYQGVADELGVSKGTVTNAVAEMRQQAEAASGISRIA